MGRKKTVNLEDLSQGSFKGPENDAAATPIRVGDKEENREKSRKLVIHSQKNEKEKM